MELHVVQALTRCCHFCYNIIDPNEEKRNEQSVIKNRIGLDDNDTQTTDVITLVHASKHLSLLESLH